MFNGIRKGSAFGRAFLILLAPLGKVADVQWTSISMDRAGKRDSWRIAPERSELIGYTLKFIIPAWISINS